MPQEPDHPVYLLKGPEPVRRAEALASLIQRFTHPDLQDFDLERLEAREATAEAILAAAAAVPFGSPRHVTVIQDAQNLRPDVVEKLQKLLPSHLGSQAVLIFHATGSEDTRKGDEDSGRKGVAVLRRLENLSKSLGAVKTFGPPNRAEADAWITTAANRLAKTIDGPARSELLARTGMDLGTLERELEKLSAFVDGRGHITREDVATVVPESAEYSVFVLVDAVADGRAALALQTLRGLRASNEPPQRIMALLARQLRMVWQARMLQEDRGAAGRLPNEPNFMKMPPFAQDKARRQAQRFTWERLRRGFHILLEKDLALKGIEGAAGDEDEALQTLIIALCQR